MLPRRLLPRAATGLGGTIDIGRAIVSELLSPSTRTVVLAARRPGEVKIGDLERPGLAVDIVAFEAGVLAREGLPPGATVISTW